MNTVRSCTVQVVFVCFKLSHFSLPILFSSYVVIDDGIDRGVYVCGDRSVFTSTDCSWGLGVCCDGAFFHSMKPSSVQMALFMPGAKMYKCFILIIQVFK